MSDKPTVVLKLKYICGTPLARCYEDAAGARQFVPRSVCPKVFKHGDKPGDLHEVTIEEWWVQKNPWVRPESKGQTDLFG